LLPTLDGDLLPALLGNKDSGARSPKKDSHSTHNQDTWRGQAHEINGLKKHSWNLCIL
jgi:hypothetical protein